MYSTGEIEPGPEIATTHPRDSVSVCYENNSVETSQSNNMSACNGDTTEKESLKSTTNTPLDLPAKSEEFIDQSEFDCEHSDTTSWSSNTPLIDTDKTRNNPTYTEMDSSSPKIDTKMNPSSDKLDVKFNCAILGESVLDIVETKEIYVEEKAFTPLHVIGSGWEFGSISSIHLQGREGYGSRTNTSERQSGKISINDGSTQNRLLAKVFSNLGSMEFGKKTFNSEDLNTSFIRLNSETIQEDLNTFDSKSRNLKNLIAVSVCVFFLYNSIFGLRNIQSSLNSEGGIGVYSLATTYGSFMIGSLISPFVVKRFLPKICIILGCVGQLIFTISNYYPVAFTIIPSSAISGFGYALMWNAVCTYITEIGMDEASKKNKVSGHVLSRYFGILFVSLQLSMVVGNFISSFILVPSGDLSLEGKDKLPDVFINNTSYFNGVNYTMNNNSFDTANKSRNICGIQFCDNNVPNKNDSHDTVSDVDDLDKLFLLGVYASFAIIAALVAQCFVDQLPNYVVTPIDRKEATTQVLSVLTMLFNPKYALVIMLCLYTMLSYGFVTADVLKAYVTCPLGIYMVGYSMICFGVFGALSSFLCGKLVKHVGTISVFVFAAAINVTSLAFMCIWEPTPDDMYITFALLGAWGFADGIWQSQINGMLSTVFADRYEDAFGCCRVLQGFAGVIVFVMSNSCCMVTKVIFIGVSCLLALTLYIIMEMLRKHGSSKHTTEINVA